MFVNLLLNQESRVGNSFEQSPAANAAIAGKPYARIEYHLPGSYILVMMSSTQYDAMFRLVEAWQ